MDTACIDGDMTGCSMDAACIVATIHQLVVWQSCSIYTACIVDGMVSIVSTACTIGGVAI